MKIRAYLALMVAAILVPVILFSTISLNLLLKAEREAALKGVREMARISLVSVDRELTNTQSALRMLATSTHLARGEFAQFYDKARYADTVGATWTALLAADGTLLLTTSAPYGTALPPTTAAARVQKALAAGTPQISDLIRGAVTRQLLVCVDVPVTTVKGARYVISQGFRVEHFGRVLTQLKVPAGWQVGVFDRNGATIAQAGAAAAAGAGLRAATRADPAGVVRNDGDGDGERKMYTVLERSALSGWTVAVAAPQAEIEAVARRALLVSILGLAAAIGCAGVAAVFFARRLSQSIHRAAQSAHALARGEEAQQSQASGVVEVDAVQAAIVAAGAVLGREKQSRLQAERDREILFASEHAARTMAEQQNRAKDEFLAMLGHELRNPLAAIVNAAGVMAFKDVPPAGLTIARAAEVIARQSGHLTRIVDDLLDVGRVQSGKIRLERQLLRLDALVETHAAGVRAGARGAQHAISVSVAGAPAWIDADPTRIEQIIANLLDNAIKYTAAGGAIALAVRVDGDDVVLTVSDNGVGIPAELIAHVFDLFVQGARPLDRAQGGLGVGLALVRRLAQMHGGRIAVHSDGLGHGSSFELRLPRAAAPARAAPAPALLASSGLRVLLIEDNDDGREMMTMMLEAQHYHVIAAVDGSEGLRLAAEQAPDIALIDIGLPGIDGYEVARRMRADPATSAVRLVALTGYGLASDRQRALAAGFDSHLVKPVEMLVLLAVLEAVDAAPAAAP